MDLASKKCVPCEGGDPLLAWDKVDELITKIDGKIDNLKQEHEQSEAL